MDQKTTLNRKKKILGRKRSKFAGYIVAKDGIDVDPDKIKAVHRFPAPATRQDVNNFMRLINHFFQFC